MKYLVIVMVSFFGLVNSTFATEETLPRYDYMETKVDLSELSRHQLMSLGSTSPGRIYRVREGKTCILSIFSVTIISKSSGFISYSSSSTTPLPTQSSVKLMPVRDRLLSIDAEQPELFAAIKDEKKNIDLSKMLAFEDVEINHLAQEAIAALNAFCN